MAKYSEDKTKKQLDIDAKKINNLYKSACVNWQGITSDTNAKYTEIISQELVDKRITDQLKTIKQVTRNRSYNVNHSNHFNNVISNREEEHFAKKLQGKTLEDLGKIINYQIPLKNGITNKGLGKIDLISFNKSDNTLYLIELKYQGNKETLLRASLEIFTYFMVVDKCKLIKDFFPNKTEVRIIPAVLVVPKCNAYNELLEVESKKRPQLEHLANELGIKFFKTTIERFL